MSQPRGQRFDASWPSPPPDRYLGQLEPAFQAGLAASRSGIGLDDCDFYHSMSLPTGEEIVGPWDLRGGEHAYVGGVEVAGRRVLEFGPASGYLTFWMEQAGASVVAFEAGFDRSVDVLPAAGADVAGTRAALMTYVDRIQNSWWYARGAFASSAQIAYGDIYALPGDIGAFDIALFGSILLHLRDPFGAIAEAARVTTEAIVVTDVLRGDSIDIDAPATLEFAPVGVTNLSGWWAVSPSAVARMLQVLGFDDQHADLHTQRHYPEHDMSQDPIDVPLWTIVGRRTS